MDCDGVIFDVNAAKLRAFDEALADYPDEARARLLAHHAQSGGVSRYDKLRWFFTEVHPVDDVGGAVAEAARRFGAITERAYDRLTARPEALLFAERMGGARSVYVVSGSDERELRQIFREHHLDDRFAAVLGSPKRKAEHFEEVLARHGVAARDAIMVGDGRGDYDAARAVGVPFVLLREMSTWSEWQSDIEDDVPGVRGVPAVVVADTWAELLGIY
jgi:phosphoglycolate phosphatase-like HAD superfamily hydrolase